MVLIRCSGGEVHPLRPMIMGSWHPLLTFTIFAIYRYNGAEEKQPRQYADLVIVAVIVGVEV